jgi:hypothetical protein
LAGHRMVHEQLAPGWYSDLLPTPSASDKIVPELCPEMKVVALGLGQIPPFKRQEYANENPPNSWDESEWNETFSDDPPEFTSCSD